MAPAVDTLTEDHAAVYDRQLRVWGVEVQRRLMEARVLVIGLGGLAAEIAKNIVLAGVGKVGLRDDTPAASAAPGNFLVEPQSAAGKSVAEASAATLQAMNPLMSVQVEAGPPHAAELLQQSEPEAEDASSLRSLVPQYDVIVGCGLALREVAVLDDLCRTLGKKLFAGSVRGPSSFVFVDLGPTHVYTVKGEVGEKVFTYATFREALAADLATCFTRRTHPLYLALRACWEFEQESLRPAAGPADVAVVRAASERLAAATAPGKAAASPAAAAAALLPEGLLEGFILDAPRGGGGGGGGDDGAPRAGDGADAGAAEGAEGPMPLGELAPVCAIVGGVVANNVLRAVSHVQAPLRNLFLYSYMVRDGLGVEEYFG